MFGLSGSNSKLGVGQNAFDENCHDGQPILGNRIPTTYRRRAGKLFSQSARQLADDDHFGGISATQYLEAFKHRIVDVIAQNLRLMATSRSESRRVVIIGGWPGITSVSLRLAGYEVLLVDHPAMLSTKARKFMSGLGIETMPLDLRNLAGDSAFATLPPSALIECCECIEHWNFNPRPRLDAMVRILDQRGGRLFLTVPNLASLYQRARLLTGSSIYGNLRSFQKELFAPDENAFERHWREYTRAELVALVSSTGAIVESSWHQFHPRLDKTGAWRAIYNCLLTACPPFREHIGVIARSKESL
jgi:SAM-dependent methyltransferase